MIRKELLELARQLMLNNQQFGAALTGSIMLALRGIDLGREPHDIDIIIDKELTDEIINNLWLPKNSKQLSSVYPDSVKFMCEKVVVDFLFSTEDRYVHNGFVLGSIEYLLKAKNIFASQCVDPDNKHARDIEVIEDYLHHNTCNEIC